ncbi:MAG TPA: hypothetical protein VNK04_08940 [Gemmataceae bacterium]|nr:hypothetical protein [Gemmataceae bacterium]
MALPKAPEARLYYRAAWDRYDDAQLLLNAKRTTGAVYLAGYTVECLLKALILASVAPRLRRELFDEFHGSRAHNLEWLGSVYRRRAGGTIPQPGARHLSRVASWSTDLRYATGTLTENEAGEFMDAVIAFATRANGRM